MTMFQSKIKLILPVLLVISTRLFAEQSCNGSSVTTQDDDFIISDDEPALITHSKTGLIWARCAVGQEWNSTDGVCENEGEDSATQFTWKEALQLSDSFKLEGETNWRLPNIKELASIVERSCVSPSANQAIFESTPSNNFWSSSTNTASGKKAEAWAVSFSNGRLDSKSKSARFYVRMVKYAE